MYLLSPKRRLARLAEYDELPFFFFAGPDLGGGDWQYQMFLFLSSHMERFIAAIPRRYPESHPLRHSKYEPLLTHESYAHQLPWERENMERAAFRHPHGCLIIYHAEEDKSEPRSDGEPYARDTRGETGEYRGRLIDHPTYRVVYGGEPGYSGIKTVIDNNTLALGADFPFYWGVEEAGRAALVMRNRPSSEII